MRSKPRLLTSVEIDLVSGAAYWEGGAWVVVGNYSPSHSFWGGGGNENPWGNANWESLEDGGGGGSPEYMADLADMENQEIINNLGRPYTAAEQADIDDLRAAVEAAVLAALNMSSATAYITPTGERISADEVRAAILRADIAINPAGTPYRNNGVGEVDWNNGNPVIRYNIDTVHGYNQIPGGLNYLFLHEIGHSVKASVDSLYRINADGIVTTAEFNAHELLANDIALAMANSFNMTSLPAQGAQAPSQGYSPSPHDFR